MDLINTIRGSDRGYNFSKEQKELENHESSQFIEKYKDIMSDMALRNKLLPMHKEQMKKLFTEVRKTFRHYVDNEMRINHSIPLEKLNDFSLQADKILSSFPEIKE